MNSAKVISAARAGTAFKAYDIRGRVPEELDADIAYSIGRGYADFVRPRKVVIGHDVRLSSPALSDGLTSGLMDGGAEVYDLGLCGTEEVYFATFHEKLDGGIMVTASHNPANYNGMKLVRADAQAISGDSGLDEIRASVIADRGWTHGDKRRAPRKLDVRTAYVHHLLSYVERGALKPLRVVVNAGNGCAGPVIDALEPYLPFELIKLQHEPDGCFPNGIPNPLLPANRTVTAEAIRVHGADLGIAWDGDFDRCFFFDAAGDFVEGYYVVGLLAQIILARHPRGKIIHDPRLTWNTIEMVVASGGTPLQSKTGHAFIKERMRAEDAVYGGEMSAHHYFRDFHYCDSGMIPWLLLTELMSRSGQPLARLVSAQQRAFPVSGEINRQVIDPDHILAIIEARYRSAAKQVDHTDGLSVEYPDWRFNLRKSNTEPTLRLNVETRGDPGLLENRTRELLDFIESADPHPVTD